MFEHSQQILSQSPVYEVLHDLSLFLAHGNAFVFTLVQITGCQEIRVNDQIGVVVKEVTPANKGAQIMQDSQVSQTKEGVITKSKIKVLVLQFSQKS